MKMDWETEDDSEEYQEAMKKHLATGEMFEERLHPLGWISGLVKDPIEELLQFYYKNDCFDHELFSTGEITKETYQRRKKINSASWKKIGHEYQLSDSDGDGLGLMICENEKVVPSAWGAASGTW